MMVTTFPVREVLVGYLLAVITTSSSVMAVVSSSWACNWLLAITAATTKNFIFITEKFFSDCFRKIKRCRNIKVFRRLHLMLFTRKLNNVCDLAGLLAWPFLLCLPVLIQDSGLNSNKGNG